MTRTPVVLYRGGRALVDRASLARLFGRSEHTIRLRCPVAKHHQGRALYDVEQCHVILAAIPVRNRRPALRPVG